LNRDAAVDVCVMSAGDIKLRGDFAGVLAICSMTAPTARMPRRTLEDGHARDSEFTPGVFGLAKRYKLLSQSIDTRELNW
jgi:hypothetical protein